LPSLHGLHNLAQVAGGISITDNDQLTGIEALIQLENLGQVLLTRCALLPSNDNLMTSGCRGLDVSSNAQLSSLAGLDNLIGLVGHVVVQNNPNLSECGALAPLLDGIDDDQLGPGPGVTGLLFIDEDLPEMHAISRTERAPLARRSFADLSPGAAALAKLQKGMR